MSDVVITLTLERQSGVLAAAISAIRRAGLQFGAHRLEDGPRPKTRALKLEASGELVLPEKLLEELGQVSGVGEVAEINVDGRCILHTLDADEGGESGDEPETAQAAPDPGPAPKPAPKPAPEPEPAAESPDPEQPAGPAPAAAETAHDNMSGSMIRRRRRRR